MIENYLIHEKKNSFRLLTFILFFLIGAGFIAEAQVKPFTPRTSQYSPAQNNYRLKGDFTMLGNLNLNVVSSSDTDNSKPMKYVDVDGDSNTLNSSTADLVYTAGANSECSKVVYAGLYWTGRAHNGVSPMEFPVGGAANNRVNGNTFNGYTLAITSTDDTSTNTNTDERRIATYTFTPNVSGDNTVFRFYTWRTGGIFSRVYHSLVTVQVGTGSVITLGGDYNSNDSATFTFSQTYNLLANIQLKSLGKRRTNNIQNGSFYAEVISGAKLLNKRKVKLKGPGATGYDNILASTENILFPSGSSNNMFVGYAEITDYVRLHGAGTYSVADIALIAGTSGTDTPGFYGGWSMVVIYENSAMTWKDISVYDGFAFMESQGGAKELKISGFNALQTGPVNVKIGLMAGEGDLLAPGDYFEMKRQDNGAFEPLSHSGNTTSNFFNSSIVTGGNVRNPNVVNNMGMDIAMFNLDNANKRFITNNQTSATFRYGTTSDTYVIPLVILGIETFIPEPQAIQALTVPTTSLTPGQQMEMTVEIRNNGDEAIDNLLVEIPIPFGMEFVSVSGVRNSALSGPPPYQFTGSGGNKSIRWEFGNLPFSINSKPLLGLLTYKLKVTTNCQILANAQCALNPEFNGRMSGKGVTSQVVFSNFPFIQGYENAGDCAGLPISGPILISIDSAAYVAANCGGTPGIQTLSFCNPGNTIPFVDIIGNFPLGSRFYNEFPITGNSVEYTVGSGFPNTVGENSYYAVPPNSVTCYFKFIIKIDAQCECIEVLPGGEWKQSFTKGEVAGKNPKIIDTYDPLTVAGTNAGMFFDIYRLDNSFNLKVNGVPIVTHGLSNEMQFDIGTEAARMNNIRFLDGSLYGVDSDPIWKIIGTPGQPAIRVEVSPEGKITLYGRKFTGGSLYELRLYNGAQLNNVTWNTSSNNILEVTQDANGTTRLYGMVYGESICAKGLYELTKTAFYDNSGGNAEVGDFITYSFKVKNIGDEEVSQIVVIDPLLGGELPNYVESITTDGILNIGETWTYTAIYSITAEDIANEGVYNQATVFGMDRNGNPIPTKKSVDPTSSSTDPNCLSCTFTSLTPGACEVIFPIVSADPFYWAYNYSTYKGGQPPVTNAGTIVGTNKGFEFDIYRLDNSFNMIINGTKLYDKEIQFDSKLTSGINIEFADGSKYEGDVPRIINLRGNQEYPMVRVKVAADGTVKMFGTKESYGTTMYELKPKTGNFNIINWKTNPIELNNITVTQEVWWKTVFDGYGFGVQDNCNPGKPGGDQSVSVNEDTIYSAKYYPNPVNTTLYVQANTLIEEIEIYNVLGQRVISLKPNSNETEINVEFLQADVYMMKVRLNGKIETYRVIKQ